VITLPINGGFYESESTTISGQELINWYVNVPQTEGAFSRATLLGSSGLGQILSTGAISQSNRGSHVKAGRPYFLNGEVLQRLDRTVDIFGVETFLLVVIGTIPGENRASFSDNGTQMIVIVDGRGWIVNEADATPFQEITSAGFTANGKPEQVIFIDSFFLVTTDSKKFIRSNANDGLNWSALNFFTAEADPDNIVAPINFKGQAWIGGRETIEAFQDIAGNFQRISGMIINKGIFAPFSMINTSSGFMFIGGGVNESPAIWQVTGNQAQKVSTTAIDTVLNGFSTEAISAAFAYSYAQRGAYFVGFNFPGVTFEFNTITNKWNKRESKITDSLGRVTFEKWRVNSLVTAYNRVICGDAIDGRIGELKSDIFTEYGEEIIRTFVTAPFSNKGNSFTVPKIELTMESGAGDATTEPKIRMSTSSDGGKTFNNPITRGFGKVGEFFRRVIWRKLGRFSRFTALKFTMSDAVTPTVIKLEAHIKPGVGN